MARTREKGYKIQASIKLDGGKRVCQHFCYVPNDLKQQFDLHCNPHAIAPHYYVRNWAMEDFMVDADTEEGMEQLKRAINQKYSEMYPDLAKDTVTDRNGWRRLWLSDHYKKELKNAGKEYTVFRGFNVSKG